MNNKDRFDHLRNLSPEEACKAWLEGDFGIDDEPAMLEAIRRNPKVTASDDDIIDLMAELIMDDNPDPKKCLEQLMKLK